MDGTTRQGEQAVEVLGRAADYLAARKDYEDKLATTEYDAGYRLAEESNRVTVCAEAFSDALASFVDSRIRAHA